ncbi:MAG: OmpA family protein [Fimbriimonadaceae bacterium]|nr:OmpA family protein [Chitinophagales bacterium]
MKRITLLLAVFYCINTISAQSNPVLISLFFEKGNYILTEDNKQKINAFIESAKDSTYNSLIVKGFADADGNDAENLKLSENRVNAIVDELSNNGYYNAKAKYYGEQTASKNNTEENKAFDRRVDIIFSNTYTFGNKKEAQIFYFKPNRDIVFMGSEGTQIKIAANSLVYDSGMLPGGDVKIELTEYYSMEDIIQNKLTTASNGNMLISAGMINIETSRNDNPLQLKAGRTMEVGFTSRTADDGFQLFYGDADNATGSVNWEPAINANLYAGNWDFASILFFETDTVSVERGKFDVNKYGQKIRVKQTWTKRTNEYFYDTIIVDKTIYANQILLQSAKLGWLNCDMFYEEKEKTELLVNIDPKLECEIVLVFKNYKSMLAPVKVNAKQIKFTDIPPGEEVILTGVATDGEKLYFTKQELKTGPVIINLKFSESTVAEIDKSLAALN